MKIVESEPVLVIRDFLINFDPKLIVVVKFWIQDGLIVMKKRLAIKKNIMLILDSVEAHFLHCPYVFDDTIFNHHIFHDSPFRIFTFGGRFQARLYAKTVAPCQQSKCLCWICACWSLLIRNLSFWIFQPKLGAFLILVLIINCFYFSPEFRDYQIHDLRVSELW